MRDLEKAGRRSDAALLAVSGPHLNMQDSGYYRWGCVWVGVGWGVARGTGGDKGRKPQMKQVLESTGEAGAACRPIRPWAGCLLLPRTPAIQTLPSPPPGRYNLYIESQAYASNLKHKLATGSLVVAPQHQAGRLRCPRQLRCPSGQTPGHAHASCWPAALPRPRKRCLLPFAQQPPPPPPSAVPRVLWAGPGPGGALRAGARCPRGGVRAGGRRLLPLQRPLMARGGLRRLALQPPLMQEGGCPLPAFTTAALMPTLLGCCAALRCGTVP